MTERTARRAVQMADRAWREAHQEAVKTEASMFFLIGWAIGRHRADAVVEHGGAVSPQDFLGYTSADGCARLAEQRALGCRVDGGAHKWGADDLKIDAETLYLAAKAELDRAAFVRVLHYARREAVPDWRPDLKALKADSVMVCDNRGRYRPWIRNPRGQGAFCVVQYIDKRGDREAVRLEYLQWWAALSILAESFRDRPSRLRDWAVAGVGIPREPWALTFGPRKALTSTNPLDKLPAS